MNQYEAQAAETKSRHEEELLKSLQDLTSEFETKMIEKDKNHQKELLARSNEIQESKSKLEKLESSHSVEIASMKDEVEIKYAEQRDAILFECNLKIEDFMNKNGQLEAMLAESNCKYSELEQIVELLRIDTEAKSKKV